MDLADVRKWAENATNVLDSEVFQMDDFSTTTTPIPTLETTEEPQVSSTMATLIDEIINGDTAAVAIPNARAPWDGFDPSSLDFEDVSVFENDFFFVNGLIIV